MENYIQINPIVKESYQQIQKLASQSDSLSGIKSGFQSLDKLTSGWQNGEFIVIASRPAMGKTAFATSIIRNMAVDAKIPTLFFSIELNNVQFVNRMIVNVCGISGERIKNGQLAPYEWGQLDYKIKDLYDSPIFVDATPRITINDICKKAKQAVEQDGVRIIVIDYLQLIQVKDEYSENRYLELNYITGRLKGLAKELNIPIIAFSQLNRALENRDGIDGKRPQLYDLRDSGTIEEDADMVMFIHRPDCYHIYSDGKGNDLKGIAELIIAKHNDGICGDALLRFRGEFSRFEDLNIKQMPMPGKDK